MSAAVVNQLIDSSLHNDLPQADMFERIVQDDTDLIGLVGFSLHELSRREWLSQFITEMAREPTPSEIRAFMIGEETQRRIDVYRRLSDDALNARANKKNVLIVPSASNDAELVPVAANWETNAKSILRLPEQTNLKLLFKYLVILSVLVGLLAVSVNYAKSVLLAG